MRIGDMKLGWLRSAHIGGMGLIHEESQLPKHRAGRRDFSELYPILDDLNRPAFENKQRAGRCTGGQQCLARLACSYVGRPSSLCWKARASGTRDIMFPYPEGACFVGALPVLDRDSPSS